MSADRTVFSVSVDKRSRGAMTEFLSGHFRYYTMLSVNQVTSYAHCVKLPKLGLTSAQMDRALDMLGCEGAFDNINAMTREWSAKHEWRWQAVFNGRSSGYLVLYQGALDFKNAHTALCYNCGQRTWHKEDTPCTRCTEGTLRVLSKPLPQIETHVGIGLDAAKDFEDWDMESLRARVRLVQDFDQLCDDIVECFVNLCDSYDVVEEQVMVPKTVRRLQRIS
jgi:hypothetical protein